MRQLGSWTETLRVTRDTMCRCVLFFANKPYFTLTILLFSWSFPILYWLTGFCCRSSTTATGGMLLLPLASSSSYYKILFLGSTSHEHQGLESLGSSKIEMVALLVIQKIGVQQTGWTIVNVQIVNVSHTLQACHRDVYTPFLLLSNSLGKWLPTKD